MFKFLSRCIVFVFKIAAMYFMAYYLCYKFDWRGVRDLFPKLSSYWIIIAIILIIIKLFTETFKWFLMNRAFGLQLGFLQLLRYKVSGPAFDFLVPLPQGEDVYKFLMLKQASAGIGEALSIPVLMRITGLVSCSLFLPITIWFYGEALDTTKSWWLAKIVVLAAVICGVILSGISAVIIIRVLWLPNFPGLGIRPKWVQTIRRTTAIVWANLNTVIWSTILSLGAHLCYCAMVFALIKAVGFEYSFLGLVAALPLIYFAAVFPLAPGGVGMKEGMIIWMLSWNKQVVTADIHAVSLLHLMINMMVVITGVTLLITDRFNVYNKNLKSD